MSWHSIIRETITKLRLKITLKIEGTGIELLLEKVRINGELIYTVTDLLMGNGSVRYISRHSVFSMPIDVIDVRLADEGKICRVIVPDDQLSLAIGKEGQNARLAARLTGYKIDIKPASAAEE